MERERRRGEVHPRRSPPRPSHKESYHKDEPSGKDDDQGRRVREPFSEMGRDGQSDRRDSHHASHREEAKSRDAARERSRVEGSRQDGENHRHYNSDRDRRSRGLEKEEPKAERRGHRQREAEREHRRKEEDKKRHSPEDRWRDRDREEEQRARRRRSEERERAGQHSEAAGSRRRDGDSSRGRGEDSGRDRDSDARKSRHLRYRSPARHAHSGRSHSELPRQEHWRADRRHDRSPHRHYRTERRGQSRGERRASSRDGRHSRDRDLREARERSGRSEEVLRSRTAAWKTDGRRSPSGGRSEQREHRSHSAPRTESRADKGHGRDRSGSRGCDRVFGGDGYRASAAGSRRETDALEMRRSRDGERRGQRDVQRGDAGSAGDHRRSDVPRSASRDRVEGRWRHDGSRGRYDSERGCERASSAPGVPRSSQDDIRWLGTGNTDRGRRLLEETAAGHTEGGIESSYRSHLSRCSQLDPFVLIPLFLAGFLGTCMQRCDRTC